MTRVKLEKSLHSPPYSRLLELLKESRRGAGLTQLEAARLLGKPQSFISKCESGERRVDVVELIAFCRIYGVEPTKIIRDLQTKPKTDRSS
jgi:transcriptional regulator with XRE-family HTH domain